MRPSPTASVSASGTEAAEVLAWRSTVYDLFGRDVQLFAGTFDDAAVGLVRHEPVEVL